MASTLKSTFKIFSVTLVTTLLLLVMVVVYIFLVIPENENRIDKEHFNTLYHLREQIDKINKDIGKTVNSENPDSCRLDDEERTVKYEQDRIQVTLNSNVEIRDTFLLKTFYAPILSSKEFNSVAIVNDSLKEIYCFNGESEPNMELIRQKKRSGNFVVNDTILNDARYYIYFFRPEHGDQKVAIVASVKLKDFKASASSFDSTRTLYAILLMILLFLIAPLLKSVSGSRYEHLSVIDVVSSTSAIGLFSMLTFIMVLSYTYFSYDAVTRPLELNSNAQKLKSEFSDEFNEYGRLLNEAEIIVPYEKLKSNVSENLGFFKKYPQLLYNKKRAENNFTSFFRLNSYGRLVQEEFKSEKERSNWNINFFERNYFSYQYNTPIGGKFYYEPLVSWKDKQFKITVSKRYSAIAASQVSGDSICVTPVISALSFIPQSAKNHKLPSDYGYALIESTGKVLMHSDSSRNLMENFFEETNHHLWSKKAIILKGEMERPEELIYHGEKQLVTMEKIDLPQSSRQFYLVVFKNMVFMESLLRYSVINTFLISFIYAIIVIVFAYLISAFYFNGHIKPYSMYHFTWLFPNNSYSKKYLAMIWVNVSALVLITIITIFTKISVALFCALNIGIFVVFIHFVIVVRNSRWKAAHFLELILMGGGLVVIAAVIPDYLFFVKVIIQLIIFAIYLSSMRKTAMKGNQKIKNSSPCQRKYVTFITGTIAIHYILIPVIIFLSIVIIESNRADLYSKIKQEQESTEMVSKPNDTSCEVFNDDAGKPDSFNNLILAACIGNKPSNYFLSRLSLTEVGSCSSLITESQLLPNCNYIRNILNTKSSVANCISLLLAFIVGFGVVVYMVYSLISIYANRFFFFDLRSVSGVLRRDSAQLKPELLPPFNSDIQNEILSAENLANEPSVVQIQELFNFHPDAVDYPSRLKVANHLLKEANKERFITEWELLSKLEKFVLTDLASDGFVNFKNKDILINLIVSGYVVSDPASGRIRLKSYAFREFIRDWKEANKDFFDEIKSVAGESTWAKWQLPLIIGGATILILLFYTSSDYYNKLISISGGIVGSIALVFKFISTYQNLIPKTKP